MKHEMALVAGLVFSAAAPAGAQSPAIRIDRNGSQPSQQGPDDWFTGRGVGNPNSIEPPRRDAGRLFFTLADMFGAYEFINKVV